MKRVTIKIVPFDRREYKQPNGLKYVLVIALNPKYEEV